ncbi:MAG: L,D-transpeptidase family protein, partial [Acidimicrobiales bacterium]|nr:L,D-transpeptidase family protein [Acidimicrobiales bacterium]
LDGRARRLDAGRRRPRARAGAGALAASAGLSLLLLAGCGSAPAERAAPDATPTTAAAPTTSAPAPSPSTTVAAEAPAVRIARTDEALVVRAAPDENAALVTSLPATTVFGSPRTLLVVDDADGWVEVQVPQRPNGGTGWVESDRVDLVAGSYTVAVDRAARSLTVTEVASDAVVLETAVAIGAPDAPTPTGTFSVVDRLETPNPAGAYGPFALGLSGFSETLSEFGGGNGQIAIHGTDDPTSIGRDVSHGCIRVPNDVVLRLAELLPLGTPVTIT